MTGDLSLEISLKVDKYEWLQGTISMTSISFSYREDITVFYVQKLSFIVMSFGL